MRYSYTATSAFFSSSSLVAICWCGGLPASASLRTAPKVVVQEDISTTADEQDKNKNKTEFDIMVPLTSKGAATTTNATKDNKLTQYSQLLYGDHEDHVVVDTGILLFSSNNANNEEDHQYYYDRQGIADPNKRKLQTSSATTTTTPGDACVSGFVHCVNGKVAGSTTVTCASACYDGDVGKCCVGNGACKGFTGKVCKDGSSCSGNFACKYAKIPWVVGSCSSGGSCYGAGYQGGVITDMIDSCKGVGACYLLGNPNSAAVGRIRSSCIGYKACKNLGMGMGKVVGDVINSCNAEQACESVAAVTAPSQGNLICTCNTFKECYRATSPIPSQTCPSTATSDPSAAPSSAPSNVPTATPSSAPSSIPTAILSSAPTSIPTAIPSIAPTSIPTTAKPSTAKPTKKSALKQAIKPTTKKPSTKKK